MGAMTEMATVYPGRNMKDFVREAFGKRVSFVMGWMYCFMWLSVCVIEVIAAGAFAILVSGGSAVVAQPSKSRSLF